MSKFRQNDNRMNVLQSATEDTQIAIASLSEQMKDLAGQLMTILSAIPSQAATATEAPSDSEMVSKDTEPVSLNSEAACQDTTEPVRLDSKVVRQDTTPRGLTPKPPSTTVQPKNYHGSRNLFFLPVSSTDVMSRVLRIRMVT